MDLEFKRENEAVLRQRFRLHTHGIIRAVLLDLDFWLYCNYHINLCVTCLWRTIGENKVDGGSLTSRHLEDPSKAADLRTKDWPTQVKVAVIKYLQDTWGDLLYILDEGDHLHIHLSRSHFPQGDLKVAPQK